MLQYNYPNPSSLVRLNLESGEITQLCSFEYSMCALTATPEGKVYVTDMWGEVYEADPSTGATTSIVKTNQYASSGVMRSMDYDVETGKLYYLHNSSYGGCTLYEIDTVQKTFKANGSSNGTYVGLYTGYTSAVPSSPAAPEGLRSHPHRTAQTVACLHGPVLRLLSTARHWTSSRMLRYTVTAR